MHKVMRHELSEKEGRYVSCIGTFANVRTLQENFICLLFQDVTIDDTINYDHIWVVYNKSFEGKELRNGCIVKFEGQVQEYKNEEDRYGISNCRNVNVISYNKKLDMESFSHIFVKCKTVNYNGKKYQPGNNTKAWMEFSEEYNLGRNDKIRLVYSPAMTSVNKDNEIEFDAYDADGEPIEFSKISFHPIHDKHKVCIDDKYYINITESAFQKLTLLHFFVTKSSEKYMAYIPEEVAGDYLKVFNHGKTSYYFDGRLIYENEDKNKAGKVNKENILYRR